MKNKLVLFDIDWTLIRGGLTAHLNSFAYAFNKIFNVKASIQDASPYEGKTDKQIVFEVLKKKGFTRNLVEQKYQEIVDEMGKYAKENFKKINIGLLPGAKEILQKLKERDFILGILTGNTVEVARTKLSKAGIEEFFDVWAFGEETERRSELVGIAKNRVKEKFGIELGQENIFVIGDSLRDVQSAKEANVKIIAVATGPTADKEKLEKHGANLVLTSLEEWEKILDFIGE